MASAQGVPFEEDEPDADRQAQLHLCLLERLGRKATAGASVLDFGAGNGRVVEVLCDRGFDAWGCDVEMRAESPRIRPIPLDPYRLPYDDDSFDAVVSDVVFEHVRDIGAAFAEIARVLRSGGAGVHTFPPRWRPLEGHTFVPLAGAIQSERWLRLWAATGIRNEYQKDVGAAEAARINARFLHEETNYVTRRELLARGREHFADARLVEGELIRCLGGRAAPLAPAARLVAPLYSNLRTRALLLADPR